MNRGALKSRRVGVCGTRPKTHASSGKVLVCFLIRVQTSPKTPLFKVFRLSGIYSKTRPVFKLPSRLVGDRISLINLNNFEKDQQIFNNSFAKSKDFQQLSQNPSNICDQNTTWFEARISSSHNCFSHTTLFLTDASPRTIFLT